MSFRLQSAPTNLRSQYMREDFRLLNAQAQKELRRPQKDGSLLFHILGSGSKGNSSLVEGPEGFILIDAGFSKKELFYRMDLLGLSRSKIKGIILTHDHNDHSSGIGVISRGLCCPVYATDGTRLSPKISAQLSCLPIRDRDRFELAGIQISTFPTSHDANDSVGIRFETSDDSLGYLTDCGTLNAEILEMLSEVRTLALESNHDSHMLETGPYPYRLKRRIASEYGHLSNAQAAEALAQLWHPRLEYVLGMHLSETNNSAAKAQEALIKGIHNISSPHDQACAIAQLASRELLIAPAGQNRPLSTA